MSFKINNPETFRANIRSRLSDKLKDIVISIPDANQEQTPENFVRRSLDVDELKKATNNLEKGVFNYTIKECTHKRMVKKWENPVFVQIYIDRLRVVFNNIDCPVIVNGLTTGEILPQAIAFMTHQEFQPDKWNPLIEKKIKRDASKCDKKVGASTDMFKCSKCQSKNCTYYEMQTRSADEPATIFVTCLNCDKHWRM